MNIQLFLTYGNTEYASSIAAKLKFGTHSSVTAERATQHGSRYDPMKEAIMTKLSGKIRSILILSCMCVRLYMHYAAKKFMHVDFSLWL